jgi:hypothetical protein
VQLLCASSDPATISEGPARRTDSPERPAQYRPAERPPTPEAVRRLRKHFEPFRQRQDMAHGRALANNQPRCLLGRSPRSIETGTSIFAKEEVPKLAANKDVPEHGVASPAKALVREMPDPPWLYAQTQCACGYATAHRWTGRGVVRTVHRALGIEHPLWIVIRCV